jgi:hypothetical protein
MVLLLDKGISFKKCSIWSLLPFKLFDLPLLVPPLGGKEMCDLFFDLSKINDINVWNFNPYFNTYILSEDRKDVKNLQ